MAFTYILLLIYPALVGIFKSKNILCKALGFYIILSLIELYPFGWLAFNIKYPAQCERGALLYSALFNKCII